MLDLDFSFYNLPPGWWNRDMSDDESSDEDEYHSPLSLAFRLHRPAPLSLPAVRDLQLCEVDVRPPEAEGLLGSVDFARLERLQLRLCPGSEHILDRLAAASPGVRANNLRSFALQVHDVMGVVSSTHVIPFLESFEGLRDFSLAMPANREKTAEIWRAIAAHHQKTLRRFVYHQSLCDGEAETAPGNCMRWDQPDVCLRSSDLNNCPEGNPLGSLDLQCLGLGCSPKWMTRIIAPFCQKSSLQLLHMRLPGKVVKED